MKIRHLKVSAVLLAATLLTSSCVGSFSLFNKLAGWNKEATGNKFLNELIFILISPAYAVCTVADVLVLNTIEFWTGSNPTRTALSRRICRTDVLSPLHPTLLVSTKFAWLQPALASGHSDNNCNESYVGGRVKTTDNQPLASF